MSYLPLIALSFGLMVGAMYLGLAIRAQLPQHRDSPPSHDAVVRAIGVVITLTALVLGLVVSAAQGYFLGVQQDITQIAADVSALDSVLERFGPETGVARRQLRAGVDAAVENVWGHPVRSPRPAGTAQNGVASSLMDVVLALPGDDTRRTALRDRAADLVADIELETFKLKRIEQSGLQPALLAVLMAWLLVVYVGLGLVMPRTPTAIGATVLSAAACTGALFLVVEFYSPVSGLVHISPSILGGALAR